MATELDNLLASIDPARTLDEVTRRVDNAMNAFPMTAGMVGEWEEFKVVLARFWCQLENAVLRLDPPREPHPGFDLERACHALEAEYGPNGYKAAFEMARTGNEGGLYAVLKTIAKRLIEKYACNEIRSRIDHYWGSLSVDERLAAPAEYIGKFGHHLPSELTEGSAVRIGANFPRVLEEHVRLMQRLRQIGR